MSSKSSSSRVKYAAEATKESRSHYRAAPKTNELANSIAELKTSVVGLIARVEAIGQKLSAFETKRLGSFAFWDNPDDAVYDNL